MDNLLYVITEELERTYDKLTCIERENYARIIHKDGVAFIYYPLWDEGNYIGHKITNPRVSVTYPTHLAYPGLKFTIFHYLKLDQPIGNFHAKFVCDKFTIKPISVGVVLEDYYGESFHISHNNTVQLFADIRKAFPDIQVEQEVNWLGLRRPVQINGGSGVTDE